MDGMTTYDAIADAFGFGQIRNYDWLTLGKVTAVNGTKLKVLIGGSSVPADCEAYCPAYVGDIVLVVVMKGQAKAVAVKGGGDFLPLSGGTLTGQLEIPDSAVTDATTTPSSDQYGSALHITDQLGNGVAYIGLCHVDWGGDRLYTQYGMSREVSGSTVYNSLWLGIDQNGNPILNLGDQNMWRRELGVHAWGSYTNQSGNLSLSTSAQKVPLSTFKGAGCSASSNGIKVSNAGVYAVSGSIYMATGYTANDLVHVGIYKNSTNMGEYLTRPAVGNPYQVAATQTMIISLAANDVVYLYAYNQVAARGLVSTRDAVGLTIWKID